MTGMHNFQLSDEQGMIQETVRKFVSDQVAPNALELDEHLQFDRAGFDNLAELGLLGLAVDEEHGGMGLGMLSYAVAVEELAAGSGSTARLLVGQAGQCATALAGLDGAASALESMLGGETVAAWIGPEFGIKASMSGGNRFALDGEARLVTAAGEAQTFVVATRIGEESALLVLGGDAGIKVSANHALGFRAAAPAAVAFSGVTIGQDAIVARGADADAAIARADLAAAIGAGALAVGCARASVELAKAHAGERIAFGKPLAKQQAVGLKLAKALRATAAAKHLVYHAARLADAGEADARTVALQARLAAVEAGVLAADEGIQIHGGYGYTVEYHVERHYRDLKCLEVLDRGADWAADELVAAAWA